MKRYIAVVWISEFIIRNAAYLGQLFRSQRSLLVVIGATLAGVAYPALAAPIEPLLPAFVAGLVFTAFYGFSLGDTTVRSVSVPVIGSLVCLYLLVPITLYPIAAATLSGELLLGVLVVLSAPVAAGSSIIWTRLGGGNTLSATVTVLASMLLAPLAMPSLISLFADSGVDVAAADLVVELGAIVLVAGLLASFVPADAVSDDQLDTFSVATIGALIYASVGSSPLSVEPIQLAVVAGIAIAALGLSAAVAAGLYARGVRSDDCITVLFSGSMKNMSVAVMIGAVLGGGTIVAAITAFHVVQQVVSSSIVGRLGPAGGSEPVATTQPGD
ncbi:bile acid:sodium symporter [Natronococcus occultus]|uniref:Putative Na+-dependent transporter n=1 Tax=Natronococcus occultus SP4 TaxID=694430 RepID=L0K4R9_9EURY|nr:bile acid:sodium symporter [Natronococcus occultus]AGB39344.1 putative Na+-dependent transporter [Natronococcus occultus SP4]